MAQKKRGLGKGLDALFEDNSTSDASGSVDLKISEIEPNRNQPRKQFEQAALAELAESIRTHGVLSPLLVRPLPAGNYQLVAGERRWRAARMAGLSEVPVIIRDISDVEATEIALIENLQRENLNPVEEAMGYRRLMEEFGFTQEEVSKRVNKSRPAVANALRILNLPDPVIKQVEEGKLSTGHAKVLLSVEDPKILEELANTVIKNHYSVRETEKAAKKLGQEKPKQVAVISPDDEFFGKDPYFKELELALREEMGRKVSIQEKDGKGSITIQFFDHNDLANLAECLTEHKK